LEERPIIDGREPMGATPCSRCDGLAIKLPASSSMSNIFSEVSQLNKDKSGLDFSEQNA
jgi:hypothetical protein